MMSIANVTTGSKQALVMISAILTISIVDSQFVNTFYGTNLDTPGNPHLVLFISFVVVASFINVVLMFFMKSNRLLNRTSRPKLLKIAFIITCIVQFSMLLLLFISIFEMLVFQKYHRIWSILVIDLSHLWSVILLGVLAFTFVQWLRIVKSYSILIYAIVFGVILFLTLITVPLLTEQFNYQSQLIYPRDYATLIVLVTVPSKDIAFLYGLGNYVLPILLVASWFLTISILKPYTTRISKNMFWLLVSVPLFYQLFAYVIRDANIATIPSMIDIIYTRQFQFFLGISYQISGLLFAIAYLTVARRMKRTILKNYLIVSSIGIAALFSSLQPGMPFYAAYPPFGLVTLTFLGLSSFLLLIGMLGCASYVSRDSELRKEIFKQQDSISSMLRNMGYAEMERELENRIIPLSSRLKLTEDMRVHMDPSPEDLKLTIEEVLTELHGSHHDKNGSK